MLPFHYPTWNYFVEHFEFIVSLIGSTVFKPLEEPTLDFSHVARLLP